MSAFLRIFQCLLVALAAGVIEVAAEAENQEHVKDQDYGTDVKVSTSLNIVHWIFIPGLSVVLVVVGCAIFQRLRSMQKVGASPSTTASQEHVRRVEYKTTAPPRPTERQASDDSIFSRETTASVGSKDNVRSISSGSNGSNGMGAIILCSECSISCREAVELLYQECPDLSAFQDIRDVKSANGDTLPFMVQVPEAHLEALEVQYMCSGMLDQISFVRPSDCRSSPSLSSPFGSPQMAALCPTSATPAPWIPVAAPSSLKPESSEKFNEDNDNRV